MYIRIMSDEEDGIFIDNFVATCYSLPTIPMDLPVTFDDPTINYGTIDFGGNASSFVVDPTDAGNNVVQTIKTADQDMGRNILGYFCERSRDWICQCDTIHIR